jgi:hypothetical protein
MLTKNFAPNILNVNKNFVQISWGMNITRIIVQKLLKQLQFFLQKKNNNNNNKKVENSKLVFSLFLIAN